MEIWQWNELFHPPTHQGHDCPGDHIWIIVIFGSYLLILNDVENFDSADEISDVLYDEEQNSAWKKSVNNFKNDTREA